jgi:hypothetical protein
VLTVGDLKETTNGHGRREAEPRYPFPRPIADRRAAQDCTGGAMVLQRRPRLSKYRFNYELGHTTLLGWTCIFYKKYPVSWSLEAQMAQTSKAIQKHYRGVACSRCWQPIPVSTVVGKLDGQLHTFALRCKACEKEGIYAVADIQYFNGEPPQRRFHLLQTI